MGIKKFINSVIESLNLEDNPKLKKKKSLENLLEKIQNRKVDITKRLEKETNNDEINRYKEELELISLYIKKTKKNLEKYDFKK